MSDAEVTRFQVTGIDAESQDLVTMALDIEGTSLKREVGDGRVVTMGSTSQMIAAAFRVTVQDVPFTNAAGIEELVVDLGDRDPMTTLGISSSTRRRPSATPS